ncbi:MAG TPA: NAD-dependent epimerase/dehydratase family protein [Anaerolineae bacterium]|nr:NAD-dependent epimerase/dehydratase family protein [Anaerolineae bacterium]
MSEWINRPVLITGATGFIGSHLAERLINEGARVRVLVRDRSKLIVTLRDRVEVVEGDLRQSERFDLAVQECEIIFHVAGWVGSPNSRQAAYAIGVEAARQLALAARAAGAHRFIYTSSIAVYGPVLDGIITEDRPHWPIYLYAEIKSQGERAALDTATDQFGVTILRLAEVYGPRNHSWTTLPVSLAKRGLPVLVAGGHGLAHPVYIDNLIDAYLAAATCPAANGEAFSICDGDIDWREFFGRYAIMAGRQPRSIPARLVWLGSLFAEISAKLTRQPPLVQRSLIGFVTGRPRLSTAKAQRLLNWSPRISIDEGLRRTEVCLHAEKIL